MNQEILLNKQTKDFKLHNSYGKTCFKFQMIDARYQQNRTVANAEDNFTEVRNEKLLNSIKKFIPKGGLEVLIWTRNLIYSVENSFKLTIGKYYHSTFAEN